MTENLTAESKAIFDAACNRLNLGEKPDDEDLAADTGLESGIARESLLFLGATYLNIKPIGNRIQVLGIDASWAP